VDSGLRRFVDFGFRVAEKKELRVVLGIKRWFDELFDRRKYVGI